MSVWTLIGGDINGEAAGDESGFSVSLSSDGKTLAIGAHLNNTDDRGHVRVYRRDTSVDGVDGGVVWTLIVGDIDGEFAGDQSGRSVSLSGDGNTLAIGAHLNNTDDRGHVRVYKLTGPQNITFNQPGVQTFGTTPTLTATSSSGLQVTFTTSTPDVCTITAGGVLTFISVGTCIVHADQAGNTNFNPALRVTHTFNVVAQLISEFSPTVDVVRAGQTFRFNKFGWRDSIINIIQIRGFNPLTKKFLNLGSSQSEYIKYKKVKKSINVFNN